MNNRLITQNRGFTLAEVMLALGIVGVLVILFVAMFVPARQTVQSALTLQDSDRITRALSSELNILRPNERAKAESTTSQPNAYIGSFDKAFDWMQGSTAPGTSVVVYNYRSDLSKPERQDGTFPPYSGNASVPGANTLITTAACRANNAARMKDLAASIGPVFVVKMTQLVVKREQNKEVHQLQSAPGIISNPFQFTTVISKAEQYISKPQETENPAWGGDVMYKADFYTISNPTPNSLKKTTWANFKKPVFSRILIFRR